MDFIFHKILAKERNAFKAILIANIHRIGISCDFDVKKFLSIY